ncbi:epoxide hydrolase [Russula decolorans]
MCAITFYVCSMMTRSYRPSAVVHKVRISCHHFSTCPLMRHLFLLASSLLPVLTFASPARDSNSTFNPLAFPLQQAICPGINRAENNKTVDLHLEYLDYGDRNANRTLLFLHGWPSLWANWKYQIQEFQNDYRIIAPNLRGFGGSTHPGDVQSSGTLFDVVGDIMCILGHANVTQAVVIGHDWGSQIAYEAARERPDVFTAVVGISAPYVPAAGPYTPISTFVELIPHFGYQEYFADETSTAIAELNTDIRRTLRSTLRTAASPPPSDFLTSTSSYLDAWKNVSTIPAVPFFSPIEEDYWVDQYNIQKFNYNLEFYATPDRFASYSFANSQGNETIPQPVLSILPTEDPVADWVQVAAFLNSSSYLPKLNQTTLPSAHWVQLELPDQVNAQIRNFLSTL